MLNNSLELRFFLNGFKPAIIRNKYISPELKTYPYIEWGELQRLYFQTEEKKTEFLASAKENGKRAFDIDMESLGKALGYSPFASAVFGKKTDEILHNQSTEKRFLLNYYGLRFVTFETTIVSDLHWLIETYPIPKHYPGMIRITDFDESTVSCVLNYGETFNFPEIFRQLKIEEKLLSIT